MFWRLAGLRFKSCNSSYLFLDGRTESNLRMHNDELIRKVRKYQEQRDFYGEERIKAINERDEARKERDEMYQQFIDVQNEKDSALERFLLETRDFERLHEIGTAELQNLRESLARTEEEIMHLSSASPSRGGPRAVRGGGGGIGDFVETLQQI